MNNTWIALDCNYLCHRAFYAMGNMRLEGTPTGVFFGVFQDLLELEDLFGSEQFLFCFDSRTNLRKEMLPCYKANRKSRTPEEAKAKKKLHVQIKRLRTKILPRIGFQNIFVEPGYEADDLIATFCNSSFIGEEVVIVSSDHDLYQLLSSNVMLWNPQKKLAVTSKHFRKEWGMSPAQWVEVKAIAGCSTDNIPGIPGVGERTAAKWVRRELKHHTKAYQSISRGLGLVAKNMELVRLPLQGCPSVLPKPDRVTEENWRFVLEKLGMKKLLQKKFRRRRSHG